jgi:hypothetical protein
MSLPAKAGNPVPDIARPGHNRKDRVYWMPACAGMTAEGAGMTAGVSMTTYPRDRFS